MRTRNFNKGHIKMQLVFFPEKGMFGIYSLSHSGKFTPDVYHMWMLDKVINMLTKMGYSEVA